jgi:acetylornithine/N-succinyldiaminopimelate aminotransferase
MERAFFCNSGTEAIEACLKLVRRHFYGRGEPERRVVVAFENAFHGRTLGALAVTGTEKYREGFGPLPGARHVAYGDLDGVRRALGPEVAAVIVEPLQAEGGVIPPPPGFLAGLSALCSETGTLLIADEIQTGLGRTGTFLACEASGVRPDVVALAKGLAGGVPIGAMLCRGELTTALPPGSHGSTFGGNALAAAAGLSVLSILESEQLTSRARELGPELARGLAGLAERHPAVVETSRGTGLLQALVLRDSIDTRAVLNEVASRGLLLSVAGVRALRFSPPLVVKPEELAEALTILDGVLAKLASR